MSIEDGSFFLHPDKTISDFLCKRLTPLFSCFSTCPPELYLIFGFSSSYSCYGYLQGEIFENSDISLLLRILFIFTKGQISHAFHNSLLAY